MLGATTKDFAIFFPVCLPQKLASEILETFDPRVHKG